MATSTEVKLLVPGQDESTRARGRESLVAAGILHLGMVVLLLISPAVLAEPERQARMVPLENQELTMLALPPDLRPKPDQGELTPEERRRIARERSLTPGPDFLTVPEAEKPLRAPRLPPAPPPAEPSDSFGDEDAGARRGQPEGTGEREEGPTEFARLEDLPPRPGQDDSELQLPEERRAGKVIREGLRSGQGRGVSRLPEGLGDVEPNFNTPFPTILSDTRGVDFGPYLIRLLREVRRNWYAVIPESARWGEQGRVVIIFSIFQDGSVPAAHPTIVRSSGRSHLDRPALAAIRASQPFPPLPKEFTGERIVLQFTFLYNLPLDYEGPL